MKTIGQFLNEQHEPLEETYFLLEDFSHISEEDLILEDDEVIFEEMNFGDRFAMMNEDVAQTEAHTNPNWREMRAGAQKYFSSSTELQGHMQKEAGKMRAKITGPEASNPKLAKSGKFMGNEKSNPKFGKYAKKIPIYKTLGVSLAPSTMSGIDTCPAATPECKASCLGKSAGRAVMSGTRNARIAKTHFAMNHPAHFYAGLDKEITGAKTAAHKEGKKLAVRLNVASDIPHEHLAPELFKKHHDVQFYDYTKLSGRTKNKSLPSNYHLTVSSTGLNHPTSNWHQVRQHLDKGGVASMVFAVKQGRRGAADSALPSHVHDEETGKKYRVIDGDPHDHRHLDKAYNEVPHHEGVIAGLRLKGGGPNLERAGNFAVRPEAGGHVAIARKGASPKSEPHPAAMNHTAASIAPSVGVHKPIKLHDFVAQHGTGSR